jgi:predicted AlkP superfamily phosphohydrolase/phosphomutase
MGENKKVLVIGLDGATWNIIEPMVRQGKLPTIERLMKSGCYGNLESCIPACTFPAWKCYSTGKEPGKLGVYSFLDVDVIKQEITLANSTSFKSDELWDILSANNITCGVINMPTTYPPKAINGAMISPGTPKHAGFAYPASLEQELINRFNYKMDPDYLPELSKDAAIPSIKHIINQTFDVASYLLQQFDLSFLHITIFDIDTIHHHYWKDMEDDDAKYGRVIEDFWVLIDSRIGSLLAEFGTEKTYVFLMSDHGQTRMKGMFYINKWLQEKNMMTMRTQKLGMIPRLAKLSQTNTAINHILGAMLTLPRFRSFIRRMAGQLSLNPLSNQIDWSQSKVIPTTFGLIYINRLIIDSADQLESRFKEHRGTDNEGKASQSGIP